jgi:hypothetical protein
MEAQIAVAIISASTAIVVAALTFFLTKSKERADHLRQRKQDQYQELLSAMSLLGDDSIPDRAQVVKRWSAAVNMIALVAPQEVIIALMNWRREVRKGITQERHDELYKALVIALRKSLELPYEDDPATFPPDFTILGYTAPKPVSPSKDKNLLPPQ